MHGMAYVLLFTNRAAHAGHAVSSLTQWLQALHAAPWQSLAKLGSAATVACHA